MCNKFRQNLKRSILSTKEMTHPRSNLYILTCKINKLIVRWKKKWGKWIIILFLKLWCIQHTLFFFFLLISFWVSCDSVRKLFHYYFYNFHYYNKCRCPIMWHWTIAIAVCFPTLVTSTLSAMQTHKFIRLIAGFCMVTSWPVMKR